MKASLLKLAKLLKRPIGIWILVVWCALQGAVGAFIGFDPHGMRGVAAWLFVAVQIAFIAGLLLPLKPARHFLATYVALQIVATGTAVWSIVFVGIAWGLRRTDMPLVIPVAIYQLFLAWAFMYIWHPSVQEYLKDQVIARAD